MDSGHKAFCPWKENACSETLAQFPPTPVEALAEAFQDRCDALYQLSALPVLSSSIVDYLKKSKGPQVEHFISQPVSNLALPNGIPDGAAVTAAVSAFYQVRPLNGASQCNTCICRHISYFHLYVDCSCIAPVCASCLHMEVWMYAALFYIYA